MHFLSPAARLMSATPNAEQLIEEAGRVCYQSEPRGDTGAFVRKLIARGHESVLEHASATLGFIMDRGISHEQVRHRIASYSQESTRFCNYSKGRLADDGIGLIPPLGLDEEDLQDLRELGEHSERVYNKWLAKGHKPQTARDVLLTCLKTEIVVTYNFREWRLFLNLRTAPAAHPKMQVIANMARDILVSLAPNVFFDR